MTHPRLLFSALLCVGGSLLASGCSQGPWGWGKSSDKDAAANAESLPGGTLDPIASHSKPDDKMPKNPLALARLSERRNQPAQAERMYQEIIKKSPKDPAAYHRLAVLYAKQGKMKQAEENFNRALALKADEPEILSDAGYFYYLTGRPQQAEQHLRRALELSPGNRKYTTNLALAVGEQGRRDEAYTLFRKAGTDLQATANIAFVHSQRGEYKQAMAMYDRALTEDPSMRVAADALVELSKRTSDKDPERTSPAKAENATTLASHTTPASNASASPSAPSASDSLVTISEGRPVSPGDAYLAGAASERPAPGLYPATPIAANGLPRVGCVQAESSNEVACAYAAPTILPPPESPPKRAQAEFAAPLPEPAAIKVGPSGSALAQLPAPPTSDSEKAAVLRTSFPWQSGLPMGFAAAGILFLGVGATVLIRGRRPPRTPEAWQERVQGRHRSGRHPFRQRGISLRIRPAAEHSRRSRS